MKTIIHDLDEELRVNDSFIINNENIHSCKGCFSCWVRTPRKCIYKDKIQNISSMLLCSKEIIIISKCVNGCYSYKIKQILERCIGFVQPFFTIRNNQIHHKPRTNKKINLTVYFYGDVTDNDKLLANQLVKANCMNFNINIKKINFFDNIGKIKEELI